MSDLPEGWIDCNLQDCVSVLDSLRIPVNSDERKERQGNVPYYGATGQVGWIDDFLFDEELLLIGEDGAPFFDKTKPISYIVRGKSWVNNHAHVLRALPELTSNLYLKYFLDQFDFHEYVNGTTRLKLTQGSMNEIPVLLPPLNEQRRIVAKLEKLLGRVDAAQARLATIPRILKRFRQSVLAAACSGRLTADWREANSTIEPASERLRELGAATIQDEGLNDLPASWEWCRFGDFVENHDGRRIPIESKEREKRKGAYPYYGASGIIDSIDGFTHDGSFLLIGEDGANLVARSKPIAFLAKGRIWVNNHAHVVKCKSELPNEYLCHYINSIDLSSHKRT
jgi:type I restriction enzyme S subunit